MNTLKTLTLAVTVLLTACSDPVNETLKELKQVEAENATENKPLPKADVVNQDSYRASSYRSPFQPPPELKTRKAIQQPTGVKLDLKRMRQPLEFYMLDQLAMTGVVGERNRWSALIRTPEGRVMILNTGDYLGTNFGRITSIGPKGIEISETVMTPEGIYVNRKTYKPIESSVITQPVAPPSQVAGQPDPSTQTAKPTYSPSTAIL